MKVIELWKKLKSASRALTWTDVFDAAEGTRSVTGVQVNEFKAMQLTAVYACVTYISDYCAALPKFIYRRNLPRGKSRATDHYLYNLIHDQPNEYMNDYEFVETMTGHVLLWGNAYADVQRNGSGEVVALWPLRPDCMRLQIYNGKVYYYYRRPDGIEQQLGEVFHLRGPGSDGISGQSPIQLHKEAIGLAFAEQEYRSRFFVNNASPGGVLEHPARLSDKAVERLKKEFGETGSGLSNQHRTRVLEEGLKWHQIGLPARDIEFIEGRKYQKAEIASIYRVRPYKIGIMDPGSVSFASVEAQQIDNHTDTMRPWVIRWEKKYSSLLTPAERKIFFVEFLFDAILRADSESRARTLAIWRMNGLITADDWLEMENRNPLPDKKGQDYWQPANMLIVGEEPPAPALPGGKPKE